MSYTEKMDTITGVASADLSASQYEIVDVNSSGKIAVVGTKGAKCLGVLQNKPSASGMPCEVAVGNVAKVAAGAAVTAGSEVISDATGRAIAKDAGRQFVLGTALESAATAGVIIPVLIKRYQAASDAE